MKNIIDLLLIADLYGISNTIDTAKGMYKIPNTYKDCAKLWKRIWKSK